MWVDMNFRVHTWNTRQSTGKIALSDFWKCQCICIFTTSEAHDGNGCARFYQCRAPVSGIPRNIWLSTNGQPSPTHHGFQHQDQVDRRFASSEGWPLVKKKNSEIPKWKNRNGEKSVPDSRGGGYYCRDTSQRMLFYYITDKDPGQKKQNTFLLPTVENHD